MNLKGNRFPTNLGIKSQQWIGSIVDNPTMTVGIDQGVATRYVFAPSVLELILNVAGVAVVD